MSGSRAVLIGVLAVAVVGLGVIVWNRPKSESDVADQRHRSSNGAGTSELRRVTADSPEISRGDTRVGDGSRKSESISEAIERLGYEMMEARHRAEIRHAFEKLLALVTAENAPEIYKQLMRTHVPPDAFEFLKFHQVWGRVAGAEAVINGAGHSKKAAEAAMAGWARDNPEAAREFFDGLKRRGVSIEPVDPQKARGRTDDVLSQQHLRAAFVEGLAGADPGLATEFLHSELEAGEIGEKDAGHLIRAVAHDMAQDAGHATAQEWAEKVPSKLRSEAHAGVVRDIAAEDVAKALDYLAGLNPDEYNGAGYYHTFSIWTEQDPEAASAYAAEMPDSYRRDEAMKAIAHKTINEDSMAALEWAEAIAEPSFRHRSFRDTFETWTYGNPTAASEYLTGMESSPERDYAIQGFAKAIAKEDPRSAIAWADAVGDEVMREDALVTVAQKYLESDPNAAHAWLPESGLSEAAIVRVFEPYLELDIDLSSNP